MPLVRGEAPPAAVSNAIKQLKVPSPVLAGLYLYCDCWEEAHAAADVGQSRESYYWHSIVHRQEPDFGNSAYWLRQAGALAIFPKLREEATALGYPASPAWDPYGFFQFCESGSSPVLAIKIQLVEWQLLFDHCVRERIA